MTGFKPDMLVVPALMSQGTTPGFVRTRSELNQAGVQTPPLSSNSPLNADSIIYASEYDLTVNARERRDANVFFGEQLSLLEQVEGLVVVNDVTEEVWSSPSSNHEDASEVICRVPRSVGYIAAKLLGLATEVYGERSGRVFLSHGYPDVAELFSINSKARSVATARHRLLGVYRLGPIPLYGKMSAAIEMAKTR